MRLLTPFVLTPTSRLLALLLTLPTRTSGVLTLFAMCTISTVGPFAASKVDPFGASKIEPFVASKGRETDKVTIAVSARRLFMFYHS